MFVPQKSLNIRHLTTALCRWGMEKKWCRIVEEEAWEGKERALDAYGAPLSQIASFRYLGIVFVVEDNDWPAVVCKLWRARQKWVRLIRVLIREEADARISVHIYLEVVQSVLIYGLEAWVLTTLMQRLLGGFHHRVSRILTRWQPWKGWNRAWVYPFRRVQCRRHGYSSWRPTYIATKTPWRNILQLGPLWICVWIRSRGQIQDWQCGGGNSRVWIWRGCGRRPRRKSVRSGGRRRRMGRRLWRKIIKVRGIL